MQCMLGWLPGAYRGPLMADPGRYLGGLGFEKKSQEGSVTC